MFLATTALTEFWDKDDQIVFLGSWCLRQDRRSEWERLRGQVMPSPWDDRKRFYDAAQYLDECQERLLAQLTDYLNAVHRVSHSCRYWRILLGPWLQGYLHAMYDRYAHLIDAFSRYKDLRTVVLDPRAFLTPRDTLEGWRLVVDDFYNLQMFSQLLKGMGYMFPARLPIADGLRNRIGAENREWRASVRSVGRRGLQLAETVVRLSRRGKWRAGLCDMEMSHVDTWTLAWRGRLLVLPLGFRHDWSFDLPDVIFDGRRTDLAGVASGDPFERIAVECLPQSFPSLYLEGYESAREEVLARASGFPRLVVSAVGWNRNERFKYFAAEAAERGSRLTGVQHGGGYGLFRFAAQELHERRLTDSYMTWGWADGETTRCRNLPNPRLSSYLRRRSRRPQSDKAETVLFLATTDARYLFRFHSMPVGSQWEDYFAWQVRFLRSVSSPVRSRILFRPHPEELEYGQAIKGRISRAFPDTHWSDTDGLYKTLMGSRLVVIDHCKTPTLDALVANVPTVLFWDPQRWEVRDEALCFFQGLREAGILHDSPEAAAAKVSAIYEEPLMWWEAESVQRVRRAFVDRYALAREDWADSWSRALAQEAAVSGTA